MGLILRLRFLNEGTSVLARGLERFVFRPYGAAGGQPGANCRVVLNMGRPGERQLGKIDELFVQPGDTLTIMTAGGGGYGHPFDRDPDLVLRDVQSGLVDAGIARDTYGVVTDGEALDAEATKEHRAAHRHEAPDFDFGPERAIWERLFDDATATEFALRLQRLPATSRQPARQAIIAEVLPKMAQVNRIGIAGVVDDPAAQKAHLKRLMDERLPALDG